MPASFQLLAAHPALDFVNTLDNRFGATGPKELLGEYADLLAFMQQTALLPSSQVAVLAKRERSAQAGKALRSAHELREALAAVLYGAMLKDRPPSTLAAKTLERHFIDAAEHRELVWIHPPEHTADAPRASWRWGRFETSLELPVWALAHAAETLLTSSAMEQVHMCRSDTCRWLFLDSSKNHSRRWCDMRICGNRMKARRFQSRQDA
jgi:predicted RNA-binding Zn ribbon-like protein